MPFRKCIASTILTSSTTWGGSDVQTTLVSQSGRVIDRTTSDSDVLHILGPNYEIYRVENPEDGQWTVEFFGLDIPPEGESFFHETSLLPTNIPPTAIAMDDITVEATSFAGASVILDGSQSFDPNGDVLSFTWKDSGGNTISQSQIDVVTLSLGEHIITLTVDDGRGGSSSDMVTIQVDDTTPPSILENEPILIESTNPDGEIVEYQTPFVEDLADPNPTIDCSPPSGSQFPFGPTLVICTAEDLSGNTRLTQFLVSVNSDTLPVQIQIDFLKSQVSTFLDEKDAKKITKKLDKVTSSLNPPDDTANNLKKILDETNKLLDKGKISPEEHADLVTAIESGDVGEINEVLDRITLSEKDLKKLTKTLAKLNSNQSPDIGKACKELDGFIKDIQKLVSKGKLTQEEAVPLITAVLNIKAGIGCS